MLNFETHGLTNDYINYLFYNSFLLMITLPTRIKHKSATLIDNIYNSGIIISSLSDHFPVFYFEKGKHPKIEMAGKM